MGKVVLFAVILVQRMKVTGIMQTLSLVTSWAQAATKYSKIIFLKDLFPYCLKPIPTGCKLMLCQPAGFVALKGN